MRLAVTHAARRDLKAIARYTQKEWGAARRARYLEIIRARFADLLAHPALGPPREDVAQGCRGLAVGRHVIFYRFAREEIVILRVLHQRMDVRLHL